MQAVGRDITERKQVENILQQVVEATCQGQLASLVSLRDITELARLRQELEALSLVDELTGLCNRRSFLTLARQQVKTAQRMGRRLHLYFIDVDELQQTNGRLGHGEGDRALKAASRVLKAPFGARTSWRAWVATSSRPWP